MRKFLIVTLFLSIALFAGCSEESKNDAAKLEQEMMNKPNQGAESTATQAEKDTLGETLKTMVPQRSYKSFFKTGYIRTQFSLRNYTFFVFMKIFNRVFDSNDMTVHFCIDIVYHRSQSGRFAASSRTRH